MSCYQNGEPKSILNLIMLFNIVLIYCLLKLSKQLSSSKVLPSNFHTNVFCKQFYNWYSLYFKFILSNSLHFKSFIQETFTNLRSTQYEKITCLSGIVTFLQSISLATNLLKTFSLAYLVEWHHLIISEPIDMHLFQQNVRVASKFFFNMVFYTVIAKFLTLFDPNFKVLFTFIIIQKLHTQKNKNKIAIYMKHFWNVTVTQGVQIKQSSNILYPIS